MVQADEMALRLEKPNEPKVATALLQATELDGVRELSAGHAAGMAHALAEWCGSHLLPRRARLMQGATWC